MTQQKQHQNYQTSPLLDTEKKQPKTPVKRQNNPSPLLKSPPLLESIINFSSGAPSYSTLSPQINPISPLSITSTPPMDSLLKSNEKEVKSKFDFKYLESPKFNMAGSLEEVLVLSAASSLEQQKLNVKFNEEPFGSKKPSKSQGLKFKCKQRGGAVKQNDALNPVNNSQKQQGGNKINQIHSLLDNYNSTELFPPLQNK
eukprot:CAMPEP_0176463116 /NCGR_PEP_ID=MMETSP0127-20121128/35678_1 /TAXON_ID=938130 /ORGANISM="Platyophrya macrostoma, Strain WH" /LENGTH=199 /DNA_ID=CAMNT_0017855177 /DNA_START=118 /DNA_END=717 /DNA_ORIENTATION=+